MLRRVLLVVAVLLLALAPGVARGQPWRWPVDGEVVASYAFDHADPYRAGQRRGLRIGAPGGAVVRAACAGRVAFAGAVGRAGPTVSVDCEDARATYQGLAQVTAREGRAVAAGDRLGRVGPRGVLRLGARRADGTYLDPARLLVAERPPLGPAPRAPRPSPPRVGPRPAPPTAAPGRSSAAPLTAWAGAALLALALPAGLVRRRSARRALPGGVRPPGARGQAVAVGVRSGSASSAPSSSRELTPSLR